MYSGLILIWVCEVEIEEDVFDILYVSLFINLVLEGFRRNLYYVEGVRSIVMFG